MKITHFGRYVAIIFYDDYRLDYWNRKFHFDYIRSSFNNSIATINETIRYTSTNYQISSSWGLKRAEQNELYYRSEATVFRRTIRYIRLEIAIFYVFFYNNSVKEMRGCDPALILHRFLKFPDFLRHSVYLLVLKISSTINNGESTPCKIKD